MDSVAGIEIFPGDERLMPKVRFVPFEKEREIRAGSTILSAANKANVPIGQSCNGDGMCGWCRVTILEGIEHVVPPGSLEQRLMDEQEFQQHERAACLARVQGDITVTTTYWGNE
jgi:ferredoxin